MDVHGIGMTSQRTRDRLIQRLREEGIRDERVLDPLMLQLRNDEFKDDALNALVELGEPALPRLVTSCQVLGQAIDRLRDLEEREP